MSFRLRLLLGIFLILSGFVYGLVCILVPSVSAAVLAALGLKTGTAILLVLPPVLIGAAIMPSEADLNRLKREAVAKLRTEYRELEIRDAIMEKLDLYGEVLELDRLPYPIEETERVAKALMEEDASLRYEEFEHITGGSINKVVWIARHLKV